MIGREVGAYRASRREGGIAGGRRSSRRMEGARGTSMHDAPSDCGVIGLDG